MSDRSNNAPTPDFQAAAPAQTSTLSSWQMFGLSAAAGGLLAFVSVALSAEMTHTGWSDLSRTQLAVAIAAPLVFGILGLKLKEPFLKALGAIMNTLPY